MAHELPAQDLSFTDSGGDSIPVEPGHRRSQHRGAVTLTLAQAQVPPTGATSPRVRHKPPPAPGQHRGPRHPLYGPRFRPPGFDAFASLYIDTNSLHAATPAPWRAVAQRLTNALTPKAAHADITLMTAQAGARMSAQILRFAVVSTLALVASVALKYTVDRKTVKKRRMCEQALSTGDATLPLLPLQPAGRVLREGREIGDVYAHTRTVLYQLPAVWFANHLEFLGSRAATGLASASSRKMRKLLEHTVYFSREISRRIPVSAWTWFMGGLILGGVDTALYYVQLYHLVPAIASGIGEVFPLLRSRIEEAYAVGNPNIEAMNSYTLIACAISYLTSGASTMSTSVQGQMLAATQAEVDEAMKREGLDPEDVQHEADRERRIQAKLDRGLRAMGLPGREAFLFDAQTIWEGITGLLGYRLPDALPRQYRRGGPQPGPATPRPCALRSPAADARRRETAPAQARARRGRRRCPYSLGNTHPSPVAGRLHQNPDPRLAPRRTRTPSFREALTRLARRAPKSHRAFL